MLLIVLLSVVSFIAWVFVWLASSFTVASLKTEAIFNIDFMLFIIGFTSLTIGMASFTTPRVLDTLFNIPDQPMFFAPESSPLIGEAVVFVNTDKDRRLFAIGAIFGAIRI